MFPVFSGRRRRRRSYIIISFVETNAFCILSKPRRRVGVAPVNPIRAHARARKVGQRARRGTSRATRTGAAITSVKHSGTHTHGRRGPTAVRTAGFHFELVFFLFFFLIYGSPLLRSSYTSWYRGREPPRLSHSRTECTITGPLRLARVFRDESNRYTEKGEMGGFNAYAGPDRPGCWNVTGRLLP